MISHICKQNETRRKIFHDSFSMMGETRINDRTSRESCQRRGRLSSSFATSVDANPFVLAELPIIDH